MKIFLLFFSLFFLTDLYAGTCTGISRSNYSANSVLTSSALNLDFNTVYNFVGTGAFDGGCIQDGTVEFAALGSDFSTITNGIHQGCKVSYSDTNTISIGKCVAAVNGFSIRTTVANTVTWACSGCSSEAASTVYYVYIKSGSSGTTLNLLISTTAPGEDGYNATSDKAIGRFYNNASSDIDTYSIDQWAINRFMPQNHDAVLFSPTISNLGTIASPSTNYCTHERSGAHLIVDCSFTAGTVVASLFSIAMPTGLNIDTTKLTSSVTTSAAGVVRGIFATASGNQSGSMVVNTATSTTLVYWGQAYPSANQLIPGNGSVISSSQTVNLRFDVPIAGWFN